ncbi:MAG TPA: cupin domain-containing protein [Candidatus Caccoplasma intestinavium]|uniref:Cupin domain-containing protein n=1 Tax=Candidatus Caccoplasma intestinavium TaxID=2840716 RepID=A0A9D1KDT9_9BACT|nr:cupin domain-containing protein [Candidatus Caccoplasma intestinavium]
MRILLLSGGSGKRLWPLSNDARSKQFLKLLKAPDGKRESMVQRIVRQIKESGLDASITIATSVSQKDAITSQLGSHVDVVTEPERRDTFPAIALSTVYLLKEQHCDRNEVVVVMPIDPYTEESYFHTVGQMAQIAAQGRADLVLMGISPTQPSSKFGYIIPDLEKERDGIFPVMRFVEKPDSRTAERLILDGAMWNGGAFAFKLGYLADIVDRYIHTETFAELRSRYVELPQISFDYEVVEKATSVVVLPYGGKWKDLGTWNSLTEEMSDRTTGNAVIGEAAEETHVVNELDIPIVCLGTKNIVVAASPDGILVSDKRACAQLKSYADRFAPRPMYEERRWGTYKVMGYNVLPDGYRALTKLLCIKAGCNISYQYHNLREEVWTFIDGRGRLALDGKIVEVGRGDVVHIKSGQKHAVRAVTDLQIIEVQMGSELVEEDIVRLSWNWEND